MQMKVRPLFIAGLLIEIGGCFALYWFTSSWQIAGAMELMICGRQILLNQMAKRKRESTPPQYVDFF